MPRNDLAGVRLAALDLSRFDGIRVIPDVHGSYDGFDAALCQARRDRMFVVQLGDIIDRGDYSPLCALAMMETCAAGNGAMIMGNHEWRFVRFARDGSNPAESRQQTLSQFMDFGGDLLEQFLGFIDGLPLWLRTPSCLFVHAAFHPRMLDHDTSPTEEIVERALFGERVKTEAGRPQRQYGWVDRVPKGLTVVVGHDVTPEGRILELTGRTGGKAIRLDTGAWKSEASPMPFWDISWEQAFSTPGTAKRP